MAEKKTVALSIICIILAAGLIGAITVLNQTEAEMKIKTDQVSELENENSMMQTQVSSLQTETALLNSEVGSLEAQVSGLQAEANTLENEKSALETEKESLEVQVGVLGSEKAVLETQVAGLQSEITTLNNNLAMAEGQVVSLQNEVSGLEEEVVQSYSSGYAEGESEGYQQGYDEGYDQGIEYLTENGYYQRDPTYAEAVAFIDSDQTDKHSYTASYVCYDFTADFNANAQEAGYRCGFVYIEFSDGAHAMSCFNTTDRGIIYVEPQSDGIVTVSVGQPYGGSVIMDMGIIW